MVLRWDGAKKFIDDVCVYVCMCVCFCDVVFLSSDFNMLENKVKWWIYTDKRITKPQFILLRLFYIIKIKMWSVVWFDLQHFLQWIAFEKQQFRCECICIIYQRFQAHLYIVLYMYMFLFSVDEMIEQTINQSNATETMWQITELKRFRLQKKKNMFTSSNQIELYVIV